MSLGAPRTSLGTTSLGAVGGAQGTAAGILRVAVEFLTQYDPKAVQQLEADLAELQKLENKFANEQIKQQEIAEKRQTKIVQAEAIIRARSRTTAAKKELREIEQVRAIGTRRATIEANRRERDLIRGLGLSQREQALVQNLVRLRQEERRAVAAGTAAEQQRVAVEEQRLATEQSLGRFQALRQGVGARLGGLALGAVGGVFGGALIGVGFAAAQALIEKVGEALLDVVDPARHAREALKDVSEAILSIAEAEGKTDLEATKQLLQELGIILDAETTATLAKLAAGQKSNEQSERRIKLAELLLHSEALEDERIRIRTDALIKEAEARGNVVTTIQRTLKTATEVADRTFYEAQAIRELNGELDASAEAHARLEAAQRATAASAQLAAFAEENLASALSAALQQRFIAPIDAQLESLRGADAESARTRRLQRQIENLQSGGGGGGSNRQELANIAQERELILLRQRLRLLGTNIDLEQFSGKFLLEAINAKTKALQEEQEAQDRLNRSLDLQFRMSKQIRRQAGESIQDFQERRAQENRELLQEQRKLEQETILDSLEDQKEKVQDEVALAELAQRRKAALEKKGSDNRLRELQKQLKASQEADRKALESKIKALEEQKKREEKRIQEAIQAAALGEQEKIRVAIQGIRKVEDLADIAAQIQGTTAARSFLGAFGPTLVASGALKQTELNELLSRLDATLSQYQRKEDAVISRPVGPGGRVPLAHGGVIPLTNASSVFGQNVRLGEEGSELGVVLSNKVVQALRDTKPELGDVNIYRSEDPMRDEFMIRRVIREELSRSLR